MRLPRKFRTHLSETVAWNWIASPKSSSAMLGVTLDWMDIRDFLPKHAEPALKRSALASSFVAALELARLGKAEIAQEEAFSPLRIRRLKEGAA